MNIKKYQIESGLSMKEFAETIGIAYRTLQYYIANPEKIPLPVNKLVHEYFDKLTKKEYLTIVNRYKYELDERQSKIVDLWYPKHLSAFNTLRSIYKDPIIVTSGFRPLEHEISKGRTGKSAHTLGMAIDVTCKDIDELFTIWQDLDTNYPMYYRACIYEESNFIHFDFVNKGEKVAFKFVNGKGKGNWVRV